MKKTHFLSHANPLLLWAALLLGAGLLALGPTWFTRSQAMADAGLAVVATFWTLALGAVVVWTVQAVRDRMQCAVLKRLMERDPDLCLATDGRGRVRFGNAAARAAGVVPGQTPRFPGLFAEPDFVALRLLARARADGSVTEDVTAGAVRSTLSVHDGGNGLFLWRLERAEVQEIALPEPELVLPTRIRFEQVPIPLVIFSPEGKVLTANALARETLRLDLGEKITISDLFEGLGRSMTAWLQDVAVGRLVAPGEVLRVRRDQDAHVQLTLRRMQERGRDVVLGVMIDATAVRVLEAQFIQSQKMQAIGQLAGGVAHDFNNLLTAISGHCDLLLLRHDHEDPEYADLMQIHQNANRAASLVGQLLAFSRKQTQKLETLELEEVLSDLAHLLNRLVGERVSLRLELGTGLGHIRADRRQLEQVIMNLVVNARDAMPTRGTIRIVTEALSLTEELHRNRAVVPPGDYSVIRVIDHGTGIPADHLGKIFEPFFTTKRPGEGTGLGLSTVYGIVKQTGGYIFVDSVPDEGSTFHLLFPVSIKEPDAASVAPAPVRKSQEPGGGIVLLVEDEAPVRAFASRALRLRGYTVLEAGSAEEALELLEDPALAVDVFVTDVVMPGMDGPTWVREALRQRPTARVIFVSGYAQEAFAEEQLQFPNSVFLPKPFSLNDLTETVQRAFS
ncbi:ATP-binding protein [Falsirhodobacter sp. 20TX0035]|uniref:ATP-binding protein n=1 Tax=Falsirhodobacter sp. 20TX0035 TaxID=3022019 RepID=UPI00232F6EA7|nr:ATP-binding protein [Falsirhodobacter sp. 20TX0035]MDB6453526.1 ATP-binding protein [Falsirhodobacter sp. 20TX0035]